MEHALENPLTFILAGKARFTLVSNRTNTRFTYRVTKKHTDRGELWFVSVLTGTDNDSHYSYIGIIVQTQAGYTFKRTKASRVDADASSFRAFQWSLRQFQLVGKHSDLSVYHEGRCGRCGRTLTVPESIKSGFGPECVGKV